jgi:hypothetical protein
MSYPDLSGGIQSPGRGRTGHPSPIGMSQCPTPLAQYIGMAAIATRLGVSVPTVMRLHREEGLFLFRWHLPRSRPGLRNWGWATNEFLLGLWVLSKCKADRVYIPASNRLRSQLHAHPAADPRGR